MLKMTGLSRAGTLLCHAFMRLFDSLNYIKLDIIHIVHFNFIFTVRQNVQFNHINCAIPLSYIKGSKHVGQWNCTINVIELYILSDCEYMKLVSFCRLYTIKTP